MGRKVNTAWFQAYREATEDLLSGLAAGHSRAEVTRKHAEKLGMKDQSFARVMKAGRFLDSEMNNLSAEAILCSYVQVETLEKIARLSADTAKKHLKAVIANQITLPELEELFSQLKAVNPMAQAVIGRDNTRKITSQHERQCADAIAKAGPAFFGAAGGRIYKQSKARQYTSPAFVVTRDDQPFAAIFPRVGGASKQPLAIAFELYDLACARREVTPNIWFIFPESTPTYEMLAYIAFQFGGAFDKGDWLHLAICNPEEPALIALDYIGSRKIAFTRDTELGGSIESDCSWWGKDIYNADSLEIDGFRAAGTSANQSND
ncbi:hypothetical protein [Pseudomonas grandcourensis]|uniref:hypothetical protein n=1 Tax=Pseudomonas grandcourensis TaxID=3136736 RepID=UPI0032653CF7